MLKLDAYEEAMLSAYEKGQLTSVATEVERAYFKAAAQITDIELGGEDTHTKLPTNFDIK
jgi:hypothetical protein